MKPKVMKRIVNGQVGVQQGTRILFSDFATGGPMWTGQGDRAIRERITFADGFREAPAVMLGISLWDMDHRTNMRADLQSENVTKDGFDLVFHTWGDTRIARIRVDWTALGPMMDDDDWDVA